MLMPRRCFVGLHSVELCSFAELWARCIPVPSEPGSPVGRDGRLGCFELLRSGRYTVSLLRSLPLGGCSMRKRLWCFPDLVIWVPSCLPLHRLGRLLDHWDRRCGFHGKGVAKRLLCRVRFFRCSLPGSDMPNEGLLFGDVGCGFLVHLDLDSVVRRHHRWPSQSLDKVLLRYA